MSKPRIKTFPSGLRYLPVHLPAQRTATILVLVATGSKYETKKENGLAHFLEHMCFKGTTLRPSPTQISREFDALGAEYNAFTTHEYTGYYTKVASLRLREALALVADIYKNPLFKEEEIEKEKGVIAGEIAMYEDIPMRKVSEDFMALLYGDQPAGRPIAGEKESVKTFMRRDFVRYRNSHYVAPNTLVVVSGAFDPASLHRLVRSEFSGLPAGRSPRMKKTVYQKNASRVCVSVKPSDQTHFVLGVPAYAQNDPRRPALTFLAGILGGGMASRLSERIREEMGAGYYIGASGNTFTDHGFLSVSAGVDSRRLEESIRAIIHEFARMRDEIVPDDEMERVRAGLIGRIFMGLESSDEYAEFFGVREILNRGIRTPEDIIRDLSRVTAKEIQAVARDIFKDGKLYLSVIGPGHDASQLEKLLVL